MNASLPLLALLAACSGPSADGADGGTPETGDTGPYVPDCLVADDQPVLEVAYESGAFGELVDGVSAPVGIPPQGGAPYTPFAIRLTGTGDIHLGEHITARATREGVEIGSLDPSDDAMDAIPICSNVDPNAGWWMTWGVHIRYWNDALDDLVGSTVEFSFDVASDPYSAPYAHFAYEGALVAE
jgi:hypothetical protein